MKHFVKNKFSLNFDTSGMKRYWLVVFKVLLVIRFINWDNFSLFPRQRKFSIHFLLMLNLAIVEWWITNFKLNFAKIIWWWQFGCKDGRTPALHKTVNFFLKDFFSKCDQICRFLQIWSHLLNKFLWKTSFFVHSLTLQLD